MRAAVRRWAMVAVVMGVVMATPTMAGASGCKSRLKGEPCLGPLNTGYSYAGLGGGDLGYLWAKLGPMKVVGTTFEREPFPVQDQVLRRSFTWHARPNVTIVAVFVVHTIRHGRAYRFTRLPTGPHSGHAIVTGIRDYDLPMVVLQGRKDARASAASTSCWREVPCLGRVQVFQAFSGPRTGATRSIHVKLGPEAADGHDAEGPILQRSITWQSVAGIKLVAAFVLTVPAEHKQAVMEHGRYKWIAHRVPTGARSGQVTLTTDEAYNSGLQPSLLLEGQKTGG